MVFFLLSKIFWFVAAPSHILAWLIMATALLISRGRIKAAQRTGWAAVLLLVLCGVSPFGTWLMQQHENLYSRPPAPAHVDGVLILGGGNDPNIILPRQALAGGDFGLPRLVEGSILARRYPAARIVFSGGSGDPRQQQTGEAVSARRILLSLGIPAARLTLEGKSRNTWENFVFTKALVKPKPGETWLLATSAFHMPRAMAIARKTGWTVLPWPTDYTTPPRIRFQPDALTDNLRNTDFVFREYVGLAVYWLSGKAA